MAALPCLCYPGRHAADLLHVGDGGAAVLLDDDSHDFSLPCPAGRLLDRERACSRLPPLFGKGCNAGGVLKPPRVGKNR